ncbi:hypothetical protein K7957_00120 [Sphingomonas yunnanensis]|uniref:hypothetical protein n=1 Tax=Sphingomonas yunnanensis TaxID=310400 RepID=UPI001CA63196|nr:hypothetical protein [Sphingomonas yunnanensis]MBY9061337.1 hypothetical protein [Sphingomonas yunnanensis]
MSKIVVEAMWLPVLEALGERDDGGELIRSGAEEREETRRQIGRFAVLSDHPVPHGPVGDAQIARKRRLPLATVQGLAGRSQNAFFHLPPSRKARRTQQGRGAIFFRTSPRWFSR